MQTELERALIELKRSVDKLERRFNRKWKIIFYGILQGAGAIIGATLVVLIFSIFFDLFHGVPVLSGFFDAIREAFYSTR